MKKLLRAAMLFFGVSLVGLALAPQANAGSYSVKDCDGSVPGLGVISFSKTPSSAPFTSVDGCQSFGAGNIYAPASKTFNLGDSTTMKYTTIAGSKLTEVAFWYWKQPVAGVTSRFFLNNGGGADTIEIPDVREGGVVRTAYSPPDGLGRTTLRATLTCTLVPCSTGFNGGASLYKVEMTINDFEAPTYVQKIGGTLTPNTAHSGTRTYETVGYDEESGISETRVFVNGQVVDSKNGSCTNLTKWVPCESHYGTFTLDTTQAPFVNNAINSIYACAYDYATSGGRNYTCTPAEYFGVVN